MKNINIKKLIFEVASQLSKDTKKLGRDIFSYLNPKEPKNTFAQCSTCQFWTGKEHNTCSILGKTKVTGDMSCNFYVHGNPSPDLDGKETNSLTPKEAGLVKRKVRCENCISFDSKTSSCMLYQSLNKKLPDLFELDEKVNAQGCCNAQKPK